MPNLVLEPLSEELKSQAVGNEEERVQSMATVLASRSADNSKKKADGLPIAQEASPAATEPEIHIEIVSDKNCMEDG